MLGGLFEGLLAGITLGHLINIKRLYYNRSVYLMIACRYLPEPPPTHTVQCQKLKKLFHAVEEAILLGIKDNDKTKCDQKFKAANEALTQYMAEYKLTLSPDEKMQPHLPPSFGYAQTQDREAEVLLVKIQIGVDTKIKEMGKTKRRTMVIKAWGEQLTTAAEVSNNSQTKEAKLDYHSVAIQITIEKTATLTILLHRLIEFQLLQKADSLIHLDQYPHFYNKSPVDSTLIKNPGKITCVEPWTKVEKIANSAAVDTTSLHIIMDRTNTNRRIKVGKVEYELPEYLRNAWQVNNPTSTLVARNRTLSFSLALWELPPPLQMPVPELGYDSSVNTSQASPPHIPQAALNAAGQDRQDQVLNNYSGNVNFDLYLSGPVNMELATAKKKKTTGFRAWMRNTLESFTGK